MLSFVLAALISIPPPLCRGKEYSRYDPSQDHTPTPRAIAEVQAAYDALCPAKNCGDGEIFENPTIGNNAVTWVSGVRDGTRTRARIVYSARFLNALSTQFGDGASFGVLAHEVGHHLTAALAMRGQMDSSWDEELRADYLAGCALGLTGRPPDQLQNALRALIASASPTHPGAERRNPVVRKGYADCSSNKHVFDQAQEAVRGSFGLGAVVGGKEAAGCWSYGYKSAEELARLGPIAAPPRRSPGYATEAECEAARAKVVAAKTREASACACRR